MDLARYQICRFAAKAPNNKCCLVVDSGTASPEVECEKRLRLVSHWFDLKRLVDCSFYAATELSFENVSARKDDSPINMINLL